MAQAVYQDFRVVVGCWEQRVISIEIFCGHTPVKIIPHFDKTVESVYRVQMIKTGFLRFLLIAVLNSTVCNSRKCVVTPQPVTKCECPICDMSVKYTYKLCCTGLRPVDGGGNGFPFALNACADTDIFIGNASFLGFCTMPAGTSCDRAVEFPFLIAVQDKGFIKLRHFPPGRQRQYWSTYKIQMFGFYRADGYVHSYVWWLEETRRW